MRICNVSFCKKYKFNIKILKDDCYVAISAKYLKRLKKKKKDREYNYSQRESNPIFEVCIDGSEGIASTPTSAIYPFRVPITPIDCVERVFANLIDIPT